MKNFLFVITLFLLLYSCNSIEKRNLSYTVSELINNNEDRIYVRTDENGKIFEVRDKGINNDSISGGAYSFYESGKLRLYLFLNAENKYSYSEEYDSSGKMIERKGNPLVEYRLLKKKADSAFLVLFFFSLNKRYEDLEITTNEKDTVQPLLLYKSKFYTNMKCMTIGLPLPKTSNDLIIYPKGIFIDTLTNMKEYFSDTIYIRKK